MSELLPCPFCGDDLININYTKGEHFKFEHWQIECSECLSRTRNYNNKQDAVEAWNTRQTAQHEGVSDDG